MTGADEILESVPWNRRPAVLRDDAGREVFFQPDVEAPEAWSDCAVEIVASRYFQGLPGRPDREASVRTLLERVGGTLAAWVRDQDLGDAAYPARLMDLLLRQRGAFNSPVWFNAGTCDRPQCSACFILSVRDDMRSILELARVEGLIFQRGSGCGTNLSSLRSSREPLRGGGAASGPVSFMRGYDAFAGVIKSGGRTRRAAKMQILDADHPDIMEFATAKLEEERKARALAAAGFSGGLDGEAYTSVAFQNSNLSVRIPDAFLDAVKKGGVWTTRAVTSGEEIQRFPARKLLRAMAESAWACGDPGIAYATTIESWNPCSESGEIRASNPCGEYLFLDDSACNLASINLLRHLRADGSFDVDSFRTDIETLLSAMEAIVDRSAYPTPAIEANSRRFRPLGLGYANLGALLMSLGLAYDSPKARGWAPAITALLTGEAYRVSAEIAGRRGPFAEFETNREPFLKILERHAAGIDAIDQAPGPVLEAARAAWKDALHRARRGGVRNAQTTLLAPTGTIAFVMDCDTTGIEPELSLVKYKRLAGGGTLRLKNRVVPSALRALGYGEEAIARILDHIEKEETIEGAPELDEGHLPVFDCAFKPHKGSRAIRPEGHLEMMAAVQPFLSGGISKTVNLAEEASVELIESLFLRGAELGLKSLTVYRENSKAVQPLATHCVVEDHGGCCG